MGEVTRQDIEETVMSADFDFNQFVALITKHVEIQIPESYAILQKEEDSEGNKLPFTEVENVMRVELIDYTYNAISKLDVEEKPDPAPTQVESTEEVVDSQEQQDKEPEIKINLNLGSSAEESEVEETKSEIEIPLQGLKGEPVSAEPETSGITVPGPPASIPNSSPPFADRKSHIISLVKASQWTLRQIVQKIDDDWGYAVKGKSSKTRVSKTIRDLREANLLFEESNGILMWRGEG